MACAIFGSNLFTANLMAQGLSVLQLFLISSSF
jgi:hypothetical protein